MFPYVRARSTLERLAPSQIPLRLLVCGSVCLLYHRVQAIVLDIVCTCFSRIAAGNETMKT